MSLEALRSRGKGRLRPVGQNGGRLAGEASVRANESVEVRLPAEVKEEADVDVRAAQVVVELTTGIAVQLLGRLDLNHEPFVDHHVELLASDFDAFVTHRRAQLPRDSPPSAAELDLECRSVDLLKK